MALGFTGRFALACSRGLDALDDAKSISVSVDLSVVASTGFAEAASLPADIALDAAGCKLTAELQKV